MKRHLRYGLLAFALAVPLVWSLDGSAKSVDGSDTVLRDLNIARQMLVLGKTEQAIAMYEDLYREHLADPRTYWGLAKAYASQGMDREHLIPLLEKRLSEAPSDSRAAGELGEAYARLGEHERAREVWGRLLRVGRPDAGRYSEVGLREERWRMYEAAIETYLDGRRRLKSPTLFTEELARLYQAVGDFENAIDECVLMVREGRGRVQWATNLIEMMLEEGASSRMVLGRLERALDSPEAAAAECMLLGSVYLVLGHPDDALGAHLRADDLEGIEGHVLMEFAHILRDEGLLEDAREAYRIVGLRYPGSEDAANAGLMAADVLVGLGDPEAAVAELEGVAGSFAGSRHAADALLAAARVELTELRRPGSAIDRIEALERQAGSRARGTVEEALTLRLGAELALGRLDEAYEQARSLVERGVRGETLERAMYSVGLISFLEHEFDRAVEELRQMVQRNVSGKLVNDALRLMLVLSDEEIASEARALLADAYAAELRWEDDEARAHLTGLTSGFSGSAASDEAMMMLGAMAERAGAFEEALGYYRRVAADAHGDATRAEAMMRAGDLLRNEMGRTDEALSGYALILEDLPGSFLAGEARRKIDRIRKSGDLEG